MGKRTYATIMLFAEGSDEGMKAARDAIRLAADEDAVVVITAVVDTDILRQLLTRRIFLPEEMAEYERELEESCRRQLNYIAQLADQAKVRNTTLLLRGPCHAVMTHAQKEQKADLLVMGAYHSRSARRDLMASEKQLIVDEIACPVLLVR
jgi:nucleotide-binding universal stress UspA family protein